jgi:hypothetical protein
MLDHPHVRDAFATHVLKQTAGVHLKKNRQKDRQRNKLPRALTARDQAKSLDQSINYRIVQILDDASPMIYRTR